MPVAEGGFACGLDDGLYLFSDSTGKFSSLRKVEADLPDNRFNDGFVDAQGCLWFGSMDAGETNATGALYRINGRGQVSCADSGYIITNGPAMSPDGKTLVSGSLDRSIKLWDAPSGQLLKTMTGHTGRVECLRVSADGKTLATGGGGGDTSVRIWDLSNAR